jgi:hypothetical protein
VQPKCLVIQLAIQVRSPGSFKSTDAGAPSSEVLIPGTLGKDRRKEEEHAPPVWEHSEQWVGVSAYI